MQIVFFITLFVLGLAVGSFIDVVVNRGIADQSLKGRSQCVFCKMKLAWYDLIPLLSFLLLRGKCRGCKKFIGWEVLFVELATAGVFVMVGVVVQQYVALPYMLIAASLGITLFLFDYKASIIPDIVSLSWIGFILIVSMFSQVTPSFVSMAEGVLVGGGFFLAQYLISHGRWVGSGDIRLGVIMGLMLGWPNILVALLLAYIVGAIVSCGLLLTRSVQMSSPIPFGVFLIPALFITLWWGDALVVRYVSLF